MDERWWRAWIGPCVVAVGAGVFFSVITGSWEPVLVMAGGVAAMVWYEWDQRRNRS